MTVNDILKKHNLTRKELSEKFGIPYATVQKWCWEPGNPNYRKCPDYVVRMIAYILEFENTDK